MRAFALALAAAFVVVGSTPAAWSAERPAVPGHVVVARASADSVLIWDATSEVAALVRAKASDADANARLRHDAIRQLAASVDKLPKDAKTVTLRVIYNRTGDVSPTYGTPTFLGVERYATITAAASDVMSDRDHWRENAESAEPAWITFNVTGHLPPR